MCSELEKMVSGAWFDPLVEELDQARCHARVLMHRLNIEHIQIDDAYRATLRELCPNCEGLIRAPFHCDYGFNVHLAQGAFVNFGCVFLDLAEIHIGHRTLIGPNVQLLTAIHPTDATLRATHIEAGRRIVIGDDCWLGGGVIVCPGITIGDRAIIGAGSVVTHNIPEDCIAVGNPARVIRTLEKKGETKSV